MRDTTQHPPTAAIADLLAESDRLKARAELMEARAQTAEEWNAVLCLREMSVRAYSAAAWLWRAHDLRHEAANLDDPGAG